MSKQIQDIQTLFLLRFTNELIEHTATSEVFKLRNVLNERFNPQDFFKRNKQKKEKIRKIIREKESFVAKNSENKDTEISEPIFKYSPSFIKEPSSELSQKSNKFKYSQEEQQNFLRPELKIPATKLSSELQYLKPIPTNVQIDLGKLNKLVNDSLVKTIECNGPDENIIVRNSMGAKSTNIILDKQEIDQIIKKFSEAAKIPVHEGVFKVAVGRLILSAIISEIVGSKFIIQKTLNIPVQNLGR